MCQLLNVTKNDRRIGQRAADSSLRQKRDCSLTWFFTGVTTPLEPQFMASGKLEAGGGEKVVTLGPYGVVFGLL